MHVLTSVLVCTLAFVKECLSYLASTAAPAGAGPLDGLVCKFYTDGPAPSGSSVLADYTIAALGTAGIAIDPWTGPVNLPGDRAGLNFQVEAIAGAGPTEETLMGALIILPGAPDELKAVVPFDVPVPIAAEDDFVSLDLTVPLAAFLESGL